MSQPDDVTFLGGQQSVLDYGSTLANKTLTIVTGEWPPLTIMKTDNYSMDDIRPGDVEGLLTCLMKTRLLSRIK